MRSICRSLTITVISLLLSYKFTTLTENKHAEGLYEYIRSQYTRLNDSNKIYNENFLLLHMFATSTNIDKKEEIKKIKDFLSGIAQMNDTSSIPYVKVYDPKFLQVFNTEISHCRNMFVLHSKCNEQKIDLSVECIYSSPGLLLSLSKTTLNSYFVHLYLGLITSDTDILIQLWSDIIMQSTLICYESGNNFFSTFVTKMILPREKNFFIDFVVKCIIFDALNINNITWLVIKKPLTMREILRTLKDKKDIKKWYTGHYNPRTIKFYVSVIDFLLNVK